ncbi:MAG: DUF6916 family protein [Bacillota bacterium]
MKSITYAQFSEQLNTSFDVSSPNLLHPVQLKLVQAHLKESGPVQVQFSLLFQGPDQPLLAQGIYLFNHQQLEALEIFIVPVGRDKDGIRYEAVFNQLINKDM